MNNGNVELCVHLAKNNNRVSEYIAPDGSIFIEGREGSNFEIEIINNNTFNVEVVVSVDGLSVIDGKSAGNDSTGYIVDAKKSIRIPGWRLNGNNAASFEFTGKKEAYSTYVNEGSSHNTGVIGVRVFKEKYKPTESKDYCIINPWAIPYNGYPGVPYPNHPWKETSPRRISSASQMSTCNNVSLNNSVNNSVNNSLTSNMISLTASAAKQSYQSTQTLTDVEQSLGTGFGKSLEFNTNSVQWERGDLVTTLVLYYDNIAGLKARGINIPKHQPKMTKPSPFPADIGCKPPIGWKG